MSATPTAPIEVLLVEDDPNDVALALHALRGPKLRNIVPVARDGGAALEFLQAHVLDVILLDLNLPKLDGREVLERIKVNERLRHIPVIVVTSAQVQENIAKSYRLNANAYVTKPIDPAVFLRAVNIGQFWLETVRLP